MANVAALRPILRDWRKNLPRELDYRKLPPDPRSLAEAFGFLDEIDSMAGPFLAEWDDPPFGETRGHLGLDFVDVPKSLIYPIEFPGVTTEGKLTPEAIALFALSSSQQKTVETHFAEKQKRLAPRESEEAKQPIREDWMAKLQQLLGVNRGEWLAEAMNRPPVLPTNPLP